LKPLDTGYDAVGGRILARPAAEGIELFGECIHDHATAITYNRPPYLIAMNMAAPVDFLKSVGMFDERWIRAEDCDLAYRMIQAGAHISYQSDAIVYHHNRDTIRNLAREAWLHGYYTPALRRRHERFLADYYESCPHEAVPQPPDSPQAESRLDPLRRAAYWKLFHFCKAAGKIAGILSPPLQV
jgi:hypothetical protein